MAGGWGTERRACVTDVWGGGGGGGGSRGARGGEQFFLFLFFTFIIYLFIYFVCSFSPRYDCMLRILEGRGKKASREDTTCITTLFSTVSLI